MVSATTKIVNKFGIHCRPSAHIIEHVKDYPGEILVKSSSGESDLSSILSLIGLGLEYEAELSIEVSGENESEQLNFIVSLFEKNYDYPDKENE